MTEKFRFMDPVQQEDGTYDREYGAQEFTDYFKALVTTGVMKSVDNLLTVSANGSNMVSRIDTGIAFILGRYYENDSFKELTHDTETLGNSRIDRVVIRMDLSPDKRHVMSFVKKGAPSTNPVAPELTQTPNIYEISLAQVRVVGGQTFIAADAVVDERGKDVICPWAGSNILPSYDDQTILSKVVLRASGYQPENDANKIVETSVYGLTGNATTGPPIADGWSTIFTAAPNASSDRAFQLGTKWNDTLNSLWFRKNASGSNWAIWSEVLLHRYYRTQGDDLNNYVSSGVYNLGSLNANAPSGGDWGVLVVYRNHDVIIQIILNRDGGNGSVTWIRYYNTSVGWLPWSRSLNQSDYDKLFQSVSNGKAQVANAITQKGVFTSPAAEFATIANNISKIQTGMKRVSGSFNPAGQTRVTLSGFGFTPAIVLIRNATAIAQNLSYSVYVSEFAFEGNMFNPINAFVERLDRYSRVANTSVWAGGVTLDIDIYQNYDEYVYIIFGN